jgi:hypothetical protein
MMKMIRRQWWEQPPPKRQAAATANGQRPLALHFASALTHPHPHPHPHCSLGGIKNAFARALTRLTAKK